MKYFDRTRKLSTALICIGIIFLLITIYLIISQEGNQVMEFSNGNSVRAAVYIACSFTMFLSNMLIGIALKCLEISAVFISQAAVQTPVPVFSYSVYKYQYS